MQPNSRVPRSLSHQTTQPQGADPKNQAQKTCGGEPSCPGTNFPLRIHAFQAPSNTRIQQAAHMVFQDPKITLSQILQDHRLYARLDPRDPAKSNVEVGLAMIRFNPSQFLKLPQTLQASPEIRKAAFLVALHDRNLPLLNEWNASRVPHLQEELSQLEAFQEEISWIQDNFCHSEFQVNTPKFQDENPSFQGTYINFEKVCSKFEKNPEVYLAALSSGLISPSRIPMVFRTDPKIARAAVQQNPYAIQDVPPTLSQYADIALDAVTAWGSAIQFIPPQVQAAHPNIRIAADKQLGHLAKAAPAQVQTTHPELTSPQTTTILKN